MLDVRAGRLPGVTGALTEGGGAEAGHGAGHEEVCDLPQGQQARRVVALPLLLLDQTLQLLLEGLEERERERDDVSKLRTLTCN